MAALWEHILCYLKIRHSWKYHIVYLPEKHAVARYCRCCLGSDMYENEKWVKVR